jgi:hypothetical protein
MFVLGGTPGDCGKKKVRCHCATVTGEDFLGLGNVYGMNDRTVAVDETVD